MRCPRNDDGTSGPQLCIVCLVHPKKDEPNRTRFTVGGDRINYPGKVTTPTADMLVAKILFNSVILTRGAQFMTIDISNFYLMTPLKHPEFICVKINDLPQEIIDEYKLQSTVNKSGMVRIEVTKGMYGLPQASFLNKDSTNMDTPKANWCPAYGSTSHDPFPSHLLLTTSV